MQKSCNAVADISSYRCEAGSVAGFIQQLAVCYVDRGYHFYLRGTVGPSKEPKFADTTLVTKYGIDLNDKQRWYRKKNGRANLQYIRYGRDWVLVATRGKHRFFLMEKNSIKDLRREPLRIFGYAISISDEQRLKVVLDQARFRQLKSYFVALAVHRSRDTLIEMMRKEFISLEAYSGVQAQMRVIVDAVNKARRKAGFKFVPAGVVPRTRKTKRPFNDEYYKTRREPRSKRLAKRSTEPR